MANEYNQNIAAKETSLFLAIASTAFSLLFIFLCGGDYVNSEIVKASVAITSMCAPIMFILSAILSVKFKIGYRGIISSIVGILAILAISGLADYYDTHIWGPELDSNIIIIFVIIMVLKVLVGLKEKLTDAE